MASKGMLNLTLDEIIEQKRKRAKIQGGFPNRNISKVSPKKNLNSSLQGRLGLPRTGKRAFKKNAYDIQRNGSISRQVSAAGIEKRGSVHSRLSIKPVNTFGSMQKRSIGLRTKDLKSSISSMKMGGPQRIRNNFWPAPEVLQSKSSDDSLPVRINNGAVVKGLRSDHLLLKQMNQKRSQNVQSRMEQKLRVMKAKRSQIVENHSKRETRKKPAKVAMNFNHGLTISIANEAARKPRRPPPPPKVQRYPSESESSSSEDSYAAPSSSRRISEASSTKDAVPSILRLGLERPPPPKPHRQTLDPVVQREIAALQGYSEAHSVGPGPGVKGFKMMPNRTKHSLNERFTFEKSTKE